jgi:site-specific DNA-methyltransferase (adenine-specific)
MLTNIIYNEDCFETFKRIDDKSIDMVLTSPPYDNLRTYNGFSFDFKNTARELYRVTKQGGVVVWVVADATIKGSETGTSFRQALYFKEIGFNLHDTMIYLKNSCAFPTNCRYNQIFEYMFILSKGKPKVFNPLLRDNNYGSFTRKMTHRNTDGSMQLNETVTLQKQSNYGNVWLYETGYMKSTKDKIAYEHPAIFPEQLAIDHVKSWSNEGNTVLDCFMGSGTTAIACINTKRNYIGCELDKGYYDICIKRIEEHQRREV